MKRLLLWFTSLNWAVLRRNGKTTFLGFIGFISFLGAQETQILPFLPERYHDAAKAVFAASILLMGYFSADKPKAGQTAAGDSTPAAPIPPSGCANG